MEEPFDVSEETLKRDFPDAYREPEYQAEEVVDEWYREVEIKLSTQGKMILGVGAVAFVTLALTVLQGKVVISLVKNQSGIINAINNIVNGGPDNPNNGDTYSKPSGKIDESRVEPVNQEELDELTLLMDASTRGTEERLTDETTINPEGL